MKRGTVTTMAIDPAAHVSLYEAGRLARSLGLTGGSAGAAFSVPSPAPAQSGSATAQRARGTSAASASRTFTPHTPIQSNSNSTANPDQWDAMLNRLGQKYNVPPIFLKAVMLSESGGRADAVGDQGHSVGLFQLHDRGYGTGMGDTRFDPETNADRGAKGLAEAWHAGQNAGYTGEYAVRAAYDYSFNPGGGWAYQGDSVVRNMNELLSAQGQPPLA
jgi:soluble lytic murein transglycosylase-like protein